MIESRWDSGSIEDDPPFQSQRDCVIQPRVGRRGDLPWVTEHAPPPNPERVASIPDVAFVELDLVTRQQTAEFILERLPTVMFFLAGNVVADRRDLGVAN